MNELDKKALDRHILGDPWGDQPTFYCENEEVYAKIHQWPVDEWTCDHPGCSTGIGFQLVTKIRSDYRGGEYEVEEPEWFPFWVSATTGEKFCEEHYS